MEFDAAVEELYAARREDFVAVREQRAREAAHQGDRALASKVRSLRKPTAAAWLVNQVARRHASEVAELARVGVALREAHSEVAGDRVRELSQQRRSLISSLTDRAHAVGESPAESILAQVESTFESMAVDDDVAERVTTGTMTTAATGEGGWLMPTSASVKPMPRRPAQGRSARSTRTPRRKEPVERADRVRAERQRDQALEELAQAERDEARAQAEADARRAEWDSARSAAKQAAQRTSTARKEVAAAERALDKVNRAARG